MGWGGGEERREEGGLILDGDEGPRSPATPRQRKNSIGGGEDAGNFFLFLILII